MSSKQTEIRALKTRLENLVDMGVDELRRRPKKAAVARPVERTPSPAADHAAPLKAIRDEIGDCKRCKLCSGRTHIVFGVGDPNAKLMFVGEGPGRDEDLQGEPFVGRAGQLLTKMIEAMGLKRSEVYIANIVKCRPPDNRYPEPDEVETCMPFLLKQIEAVAPKVVITLGNLATQTLLKTKTGIMSLHGRFQDWKGLQVMPTYHPAFLLRNPNMKKPCWEDLKKVIELLKMSS
ncbi:MAG TPA: uracil-DNA glycosylase [bacterium]|nr:uracil-DNA glycosylase [bacterium]